MPPKSFSSFFLLLLVINTLDIRAQSPNPANKKLYGYNQFQNKTPFTVKDSIVTFFKRGHKEAKQVLLAGSFTEWYSKALAMAKVDSGWIVKVKLAPGKHLYKFILDGIWETDADNLQTESGYDNSVYYLPNIIFSFSSPAPAKRVYVAGSFNNWKSGELAMTKTPTGWELPLYLADGTHLYQFVADDKAYPDPKNNSTIVNEFGKMSSLVLIGKPNDLYSVFQSYQDSVTRYKDDKNKLADFYARIGHIHLGTSDHTLAIQSFQKALRLYQQLQSQDSTACMQLRIGMAYKRLSDFPNALEYFQKSLISYEKAGIKFGMARAQQELGYYYNELPYFPKAIEHLHKSLSLYEQLDNQMGIGQLTGNLGALYLQVRDTAKAIAYLQKALEINERIGHKPEIGYNYWMLGNYYFQLGSDIAAAISYLKKAQNLFEQTNDKGGQAYVLFNLADVLLYAPDSAAEKAKIKISEKYFRSLEYRKRGIEMMKDNLPEHQQVIHILALSETYEKIAQYDSAYHYYKQYIDLRDKRVDTEDQKAIVRLETRFENEKVKDSLEFQKQLMDARLEKQVLLGKQQQQELSLSNKEKELQHLAYLKTQADLQNEQLVRQQKEKQLDSSEKEQQLQSATVKSLTQEKAIAKLNQQKQWIYTIAVFLFLGLASVYFIYRWRLRSVRLESQLAKEKSEQEKKEAEFQHKLADISLSALRSQMNPHFIFNCLNSIKYYTVQNDKTAAAEYLSKFSKLIRTVLENSRKNLISVKSELAALDLYIQMEAMRFKGKLTYDIHVNEDVQTDFIELPPLLLQPYVENAIWHGLMHKAEGGHIDITLEMQNNASLQINITDNGIGRAKAAELKNKRLAIHNSYGMEATSERIALINQTYKTGASVVIHDLVDADGNAAGTQVSILLPV